MSLIKTLLGAAALNAADSANQDAIARRGEDMIRDQQARNQDALIGLQQQHIDSLEARANRPTGTSLRELELEQKVKAQQEEIEELSADLRNLRSLLSKPFAEIAKSDATFNRNLRTHDAELAAQVVARSTYHALASEYASKLMISREQICVDFENSRKVLVSGQSAHGIRLDEKVLDMLNYEATREEMKQQAQKEIDERDEILKEKYGIK